MLIRPPDPVPVEHLLKQLAEAKAIGDTDAEKVLASIIRDCWGTPPDLFARHHQQYGFTVDLAAEPWNAKLARYCGVGGIVPNAFDFNLTGETWFCNPPFSQIADWIQWLWSWYDVSKPRAGDGVLLLPATRTEQRWWKVFVEAYRDKPRIWELHRVEFECEFLEGRTHYVPPPTVPESSPRFGSCLLKWHPL